MKYQKNNTTGQKTISFKLPAFLGNFLDSVHIPGTCGTDYYQDVKKFIIYLN